MRVCRAASPPQVCARAPPPRGLMRGVCTAGVQYRLDVKEDAEVLVLVYLMQDSMEGEGPPENCAIGIHVMQVGGFPSGESVWRDEQCLPLGSFLGREEREHTSVREGAPHSFCSPAPRQSLRGRRSRSGCPQLLGSDHCLQA